MERNTLRMEYVVKEQDTIERLLNRYGISETLFLQVNPGLVKLTPGETIWIPVVWRICPRGLLYPMARNDTLASAAQRFGMTLYELLEINPYIAPWSSVPGQILIVNNHLAENRNE